MLKAFANILTIHTPSHTHTPTIIDFEILSLNCEMFFNFNSFEKWNSSSTSRTYPMRDITFIYFIFKLIKLCPLPRTQIPFPLIPPPIVPSLPHPPIGQLCGTIFQKLDWSASVQVRKILVFLNTYCIIKELSINISNIYIHYIYINIIYKLLYTCVNLELF